MSFLFIAGVMNNKTKKPEVKVSKQQSAFNFNVTAIQIFSLGQSRMITDLLWISTLLEADVEQYKGEDLGSWIYQRFLTIIILDPGFLTAYQYGGKYLSIISDDLMGAQDIFERGLKLFPEDYDLNYNAAFLYAFELNEYSKALTLYKKIKYHPNAPPYLESLINKIQFKITPDLELIYKLVSENYHNTQKGSPLKRKLKSDLYAIKAQIDLECLNQKNKNCSLNDFEGNFYIKKNGSYIAPKEFKFYQMYKPN